MLTAANIRKSKSQAVSLLIFVLIAVMFLNVGLVLYFNYSKDFDGRAEQLYAPHLTILQADDITTEKQLTWLEQYPGVTEVEKQPVISSMGEYYMNGAKASGIIIISNVEKPQNMNPPSLIGDSLPLDDNSIYVPYLMKAAGGFELGDSYQLNLSGTELHLTIAGFTEEVPYGALMNTLYRFYVSDNTYERISGEFADYQCRLQSVRFEDSGLGMQAQLDYSKEFFYSEGSDEASAAYIYSLNYHDVKTARTFIPMVMALIVTVFAFIILVVSLIVIRFGIINSIEESMTNIGILKAAGYKNNQIILSIVFQFGSISVIGGILGIAAAQLLLPLLAEILESQSALIWNPGFDFFMAAASLCFVLLSVLLVSFIAARRIYKLHPLIALRGGLETHSFKKNRIPLEKSHGTLSFLLAMKQLVQNKKQAFMIVVIIAFVSFTSVAGISIYYNVGVKPDVLASIISGEKPDVGLVLKNRSDTEDVIKRLLERQEVRKAFGYQDVTLRTDEVDTLANITKDFSQLEGNMLYDGRYPKHSNEVTLGVNLADVLGKKIGDTVAVTQGSQTKEFLITGTMQLMNGYGINMLMTYDGLLTIQNDYEFDRIYIYLTEGADVKAFIESVKSQEGNIFSSTVDMNELIDAQFSQYGSIFAAVAAVILLITVVIVILVLYMVIKTMILRKKQEFGIQKATGFTTFQLMNQITFNYIPVILLGVLLGGAGGYFGLNPLFAAVVRSAGIVKVNLPSPIGWTIATCVLLVILAYLVSMLIAWRIRKISAYALMSD